MTKKVKLEFSVFDYERIRRQAEKEGMTVEEYLKQLAIAAARIGELHEEIRRLEKLADEYDEKYAKTAEKYWRLVKKMKNVDVRVVASEDAFILVNGEAIYIADVGTGVVAGASLDEAVAQALVDAISEYYDVEAVKRGGGEHGSG